MLVIDQEIHRCGRRQLVEECGYAVMLGPLISAQIVATQPSLKSSWYMIVLLGLICLLEMRKIMALGGINIRLTGAV